MDTNTWSFGAGYCKIKTARQKKRLLKEDRDKQLLRLDRRQHQLLLIKRSLPLVSLDEPYQSGWKRTFVLREDVARSAAAMFYTTLLSRINTIDYANDKSFKQKIKRKRNRKKIYEVKPQYLRGFAVWDWLHNCKLTDEERVHFYPKECWSKDGKTMHIRYVFAEPWRFVLRITPHMITHTRMVDEVLEQELAQIEQYIEKHCLRPRVIRLTRGKGWSKRWDFFEDPRWKNPLKNKPLRHVLSEAYNDEL